MSSESKYFAKYTAHGTGEIEYKTLDVGTREEAEREFMRTMSGVGTLEAILYRNVRMDE